ncbi:hypothetical protein KUL17_05560 [Alteromonas sp. KUL17]|uniref:hypothetical protein n=1 Tax=Alteromonas sp. KUL17 TaxID=2480796 RepID=UPI00103814B2|nr:hypothetical protein [Alteromonas sp. KUL17]TAP30663.1 hypothetical protein KUL49_02760 [Alteromonas sp. KUL17]GEA01659.1 hypothetical protein KUL17_05560 [Alteromonas sp. KUL17]
MALLVENGLDPSINMLAPAAGVDFDTKRIGWGGSGVFSSVVEFNGDIYASSDVTGVWKHRRPHWYPVVKGLTNYNITGLLVHNSSLLAVAKNQVLKLSSENVWEPIGLTLSTFRNTSLQLYSTSVNGTTCFAALEPKLACIDDRGSVSEVPLSISKLKGVYFSSDSDHLYGFYDNELYRINRIDGYHTLEYTFPHKILRITELNRESGALIFTEKGVYELGSFATVNIELKNKNIVNVLVDSSNFDKHFVALGSQWNTSIYELRSTPSGWHVGEKVKIVYDRSLPYRHWRRSMTKPIGMPKTVTDKIWFSDYWGIYAYDVNTNQFYEKSYDASNFVGTDIHITNDKLYITAMDNGLVSMPLNQLNNFTPVFPRKATDWQLAGHAWSVDSNREIVFATLSPWNVPEDYVISINKADNSVNTSKVDNSTSRNSVGSFWGQSYARKLVVSDDIYAYKDGSTGGLFKLTSANSPSTNGTEGNAGQLLYSTEKNRVYRAFTKFKNRLVSYHIDNTKRLLFHDLVSGEVIKTVEAPDGLWAFSLEVINDSLYLLGSRGGAIIYKFDDNDDTFYEIVKAPSASAFMVIREAPDHSITLAGAIDWSRKPNGKVLLRHDNENEWIDITCIMPNQSGAVDIEFTEDGEYVYILQQVSSVIRIEVSKLQSYQGCAN